MTIPVACLSCGRTGKVPAQALGKFINCPACRARYRLLSPSLDEPSHPLPMAAAPPIALFDDDLDEPFELEPATTLPAPPVGPPADRPDPLPRSRPWKDAQAETSPRDGPAPSPSSIRPSAPERPGLRPPRPRKPAPRGPSPEAVRQLVRGGIAVVLAGLALFAAYSSYQTFSGPTDPTLAEAQRDADDPVMSRESTLKDGIRTEKKVRKSGKVEITEEKVDMPAMPLPPGMPGPPPKAGEPRPSRFAMGRAKANDASGGGGSAAILARASRSVAIVRGPTDAGSGFLVRPNLLLATAHTFDFDFPDDVRATFPGGAALPVQLIRYDRKRDHALLIVATDSPPFEVSPESRATRKPGETLHALGWPSAEQGVRGGDARIDGLFASPFATDFYRLDGPLQPPMAGGPVLDDAGRLVGVLQVGRNARGPSFYVDTLVGLPGAIDTLETTPLLAQNTPSWQRACAVFRRAAMAGATYSLALEVRRKAIQDDGRIDLTFRGQPEDLGSFEERLRQFDRVMAGPVPAHAAKVNSDRLVGEVRTEVFAFMQNYQKMKQLFEHPPADADTLVRNARALCAEHRRLIGKINNELKVDIPGFVLDALEDDPRGEASSMLGGS